MGHAGRASRKWGTPAARRGNGARRPRRAWQTMGTPQVGEASYEINNFLAFGFRGASGEGFLAKGSGVGKI